MYLITGASGGVGRAAAQRLIGAVPPDQVILTTRTPDKLRDLADRGAQVRFADFDDPESLKDAFAGATRMLLVSTARVGSRVGQHVNAIDAAVAVGVEYIAYTSVVGAGDPDNPAIVTRDHAATEKHLRESGLRWNALRDSQYAEALAQYAAPFAIMTGVWHSCEADGRIALVARDDCVDCAVGLLLGRGEDNRHYDISGPELLSYREIAAEVARISGRPIEFVTVTDEERFAQLDAMGIPRESSDDMSGSPIPWNSEDMVSFSRAIREGHMSTIGDAVQVLTGRQPRSMRSVLEEHAPSWPTAGTAEEKVGA